MTEKHFRERSIEVIFQRTNNLLSNFHPTTNECDTILLQISK